jgi:hypothetical protein
VNWAVVVVSFAVSYCAGRFVDRAWLCWSVAVVSVIAPVASWIATSGYLASDLGEYGGVMLLAIVLLTGAQLGVALLCCLIGRSQHLQA